MYGLIAAGSLNIEKPTFAKLLRKLLSTVQIPFHGEPVKGLQIMGVLETRALDFKNLLMLNVNEGFMPGSGSENTFIPQFLRTHFGMSTLDHQDSIYAYYFFRLIQRAEHITLVYNTDKTQTGKAEMSRFLLQLLVDPAWNRKIERAALQSSIQPRRPKPIVIEKDEALLQSLRNRYDRNVCPKASLLSPTSLNAYISCSYQFYLKYVCGLQVREELIDELDTSVFGSIFHCAAELLYREIAERYHARNAPYTVQAEDLNDYLEHPHKIRKFILKAFEKIYFKGRAATEDDFNGEQLLNFQVIGKMMEWMIRFDRRRTPFTVLGLEYPVKWELTLDQSNIRLHIGGIIDRLEEKDGKYYIVDYKTGGKAKESKSLQELFEQKNDRATHIFQTFVYASALLQQPQFDSPVVPTLLYIQQASQEDYSPLIRHNKQPVEDFRFLYPEFSQLLSDTVREIFDPAVPFTQTEKAVATCEYCDFREICGR
jgi:hypothetical protein